MITRTDVLAHLERNMRLGFLKGMESYTPRRAAFVRETTSDGAFETYADMGATPWPRQNGGQNGAQGNNGRTGAPVTGGLHEGGPITVLGGNERSLDLYNKEWDIPIGIYHTAIEDNRIGGLEEWARSAGERFEQHMDYLCFNALNQGASATSPYGRCYDGFPLISNSHVDPNAEYQTAQDNEWTLPLSLDNFETVSVGASEFKDDRGQPVGYSYDTLIVPEALRRTAAQIATNPEAYDTANRERNPYTGLRMVVAPGGYLDSTAWFLVAGNMVAKPVILQIRERPRLITWDDHTQGYGVRYFKWVARYTVGYGEWRTIAQGNT